MKKFTCAVALVVLSVTLAAQDVDKARTLIQQALQALTPTPVALDTPAALDAALSAAAPGVVLTLSHTLVYPSALTLSKSVTLRSDNLGAVVRMDATTPLPVFQNGLTISGDQVTLQGVEVHKTDPLTDIVTISGASDTLDRVRILGDPVKGAKRGVAANGNGNTTIIRSYIDDCFQAYPGNDSQAILAWDMGPGLLIEDNFLRGGSETILIGGADSSSAARTPTQVVIRGNTITKRPEWQKLPIGVKNTLELKNATHVLIENNDISQSWGGHGQDGYILLLTVRNQDGRAPWSTVQDVVIQNNHLHHGAGAFNLLGLDNIKETSSTKPTPAGTVRPSVRMARVSIVHNTISDLDPTVFAGSNRMILLGAGPTDVTIDQNTFTGVHLGAQVYFYGTPPLDKFTLTNNTWPPTTYGIKGDNTGSGAVAWAAYVTNGTLAGNVEK